MKKILSTILAATLSLSCAVMNVQAAGRTANINTALENRDEIHILYNDTVVEYEDVKPVNTEGRVMIPFRAALESMGATVNYDDAARTVTAAKGDITITFTLLDDTIYINNNGEESTITMDVPMIIVDDRTLVPIRFMSNALGMQVGWNGDTETVVIMDYDDYFANLANIAPNLTALSKFDKSQLNKSSLTFDVTLKTEGASEDILVQVSGAAEAVVKETAAAINAEISVKSDKLSVDKAAIDVVFDGNKLYLKTDALSKLAEAFDNVSAKVAAAMVDSGTWYSVDLEKLLSALGVNEEMAELLKSSLTNNSSDLEAVLKSSVTTEGDAEFVQVMSLATMLDTYEALDKYIKITNKPNGGYTVSFNITTQDFADILSEVIGAELTSEDKAEFLSMFDINVKANTDNDGGKESSNADVSLKVNAKGEEISFTLKLNEASEADSNAVTAGAPENSVDITDIILGTLK